MQSEESRKFSHKMTQEIGGGSGVGDGVRRSRTFPPAFLTKTYQIVDDPNTNSIASWGKYGDSFVIWDHIKFSAQILPKYFRHNNFASFVYQLNNYGFRKIGVEHQWEYANPHFQMQKPHLLCNMKRRSEQNTAPRRRRNSLCSETMMRDAINESKQELEKLKMQQLDIDFHITALKQKANSIDIATKKMAVSWAKAFAIICKRKREKIDDHDDDLERKKKKEGDSLVDEMMKELTEIPPMNSVTDHGNEDGDNLKSETCSNYLNFCKIIMLEDDDEVFGVEAGGKKQDEIAQNFQDLIRD